MGRVATAKEVQAAQAFLRYVGADYHNNLLILAVVSWFYQESGGLSRVIGNNPFNIRPGVASKLASGVRKSKNGNGYFLVFSDLDTGFKAAALVLKSLAPAYGYGLVLAALRRGSAVDFLVALAMSSWDAGHYGVTGTDNPADPRQNHLLAVYASFTGLQLPTESNSNPDQPAPKPRPQPKLPRALQPPPPIRQYISGFDARRFYDARHPHSKTVDTQR